ncbi:MAG: tRNA (cytidine(34)-2'-O)-methyltransferase [Alphaproteobacteria bacterium]|nr:tRNA (cytidine(34)-2'-O)-methyltransferase [Alphaproteobacteria bacterium]MBQ7659283.1 tRNA (cytidine(34)-2'-O)-methyltransferase [Alphaproteobacteria bacterium]
MRLALFQPDIAQNTGTLLRLGACLDLPVDIIEPCGFNFADKSVRRAGMDYLDMATYKRHASWNDFLAYRAENKEEYGRIVLLTTHALMPYTDFKFEKNDIILMGRESAGVPEIVHQTADARLLIPMTKKARSINVAVSAVMVVGEALRQTGLFPKI